MTSAIYVTRQVNEGLMSRTRTTVTALTDDERSLSLQAFRNQYPG